MYLIIPSYTLYSIFFDLSRGNYKKIQNFFDFFAKWQAKNITFITNCIFFLQYNRQNNLNISKQKNKKKTTSKKVAFGIFAKKMVADPGLEPGTYGL